MVLEEGGVKLSLTIVDTPGFGDKVTIMMMLMMLMTLVRTLATGCNWLTVLNIADDHIATDDDHIDTGADKVEQVCLTG